MTKIAVVCEVIVWIWAIAVWVKLFNMIIPRKRIYIVKRRFRP